MTKSAWSPSARRGTALIAVLAGLALFPQATGPISVRAASASVVISEFRVRGPNGGSDEFVELYNSSMAAVSLGGWKIRGSNASGTVSTRATVPSGVVLNPGCHYLFTNSSASGGPYSGSVPGDTAYTVGITDDGGVAVTMPNDAVVDQVGLSAGSAYKEGTVLASLGSSNLNRGYERKPGGAAGSASDTDDNAADFLLRTPSDPQSLSSPCVVIGAPTGVGTASPSSLPAGSSTLLTVAVTPGTNPTSTGLAVTADLTAIGGAPAQPFFDDGTAGDQTAGDDVFSFEALVGVLAVPGAKTLPATITDAQSRRGSASIALSVEPPLVAIHTIQGPTGRSPFAGQLVATTGVVTGRRFNNAFFIQTPDADTDADPATSEGIMVFTGSAPPASAAVGNLVRVTGTVAEFVPSADPFSPPLTEITTPVVTLLSTGHPLPAPVILAASDTSPAGDLEQLERLEGMRVHVASLAVVAPTMGTVSEANATATSNGVFYSVLPGIARPFREPGVEVLDPLPAGAPCCVPRFDGNPERLRVDSDGQIGGSRLEVTAGAVVTGITGPLDYAFRTYTILPDPATPPALSGNVAATPLPDPAADEFTVASFNLQRFFDAEDDPALGEPVLTATAFAARLAKASLLIRGVMRSPDVLGLQELESLDALQALADRLNEDAVAAGETDPGYQAFLEEGNDIGGIDVGFLVKTGGGRVSVIGVVQEGKTATYLNPIDGQPELLNDRPPLVLQAVVRHPEGPALPVTVIVNHLRSLNGIDDPVDGPRVRAKRRAQAEFLADLVQARQLADPGEHVIVLGDMNAFSFNDGYVDTIGTVKGTPTPADQVAAASPDLVEPDLVDLVGQVPADQQYSYTFDGHAQELDHVLVAANLLPRVTALRYARADADFPESFRSDPARPERLSDHDPLVAYLSFPRADLGLTKTASPGSPTTGAPVTYALTPTNGMEDPAVDVTVSDALPPGTTFGSVEAPPGWSCATPSVGATGTVSCRTASLAPGTATAITITADLDCAVANGAAVTNTATISSATLDPDPANNTAAVTALASNPAPAITAASVDKPVLWPPNHKMVDVGVRYEVTDNCAVASCGLAVTSDEPVNGIGDGDTAPDWQVVDPNRVRLRAERAGMGDGRVYTITITCTDGAGSASSQAVKVTVPSSRGK